MKTKPTIGIIGIGFVGSAVRHWFKKERYKVFCYGKNERIGSIADVNNADIIFICVPTPYRENMGGYDDSIIQESLARIAPGKTVVIKSTILPGSTEKFQERFPRLTILFNPEFLVANRAVQDFLSPHRQIIGYTKRSKSEAQKIMNILPRASYEKIMRASEAEMVKYFSNAFLALRVIFANQIYDLCQKLAIDYKSVEKAAGEDPRIGHSHFDVLYDGYRGYGGACLPKDIKSLIQLGNSLNIDLPLLKCVDWVNEQLNKQ